MLARLFLLFTIVPSFELWFLFQVKEQLGLFQTIWLVIITGMIGASMAKTQGIMVLQQLQESTKQGIPPAQTLVEGVLVLVGGVLLVTPGILTDVFGFSLIIPFTRRLWVPLLQSWFGNRVRMSGQFNHVNVNATSNSGSTFNNDNPFQRTGFENAQSNVDPSVEIENSTKENTSKRRFSHPKF